MSVVGWSCWGGKCRLGWGAKLLLILEENRIGEF